MTADEPTYLDGNAAAGALREVFAVDLTAAIGQCAGCGDRGVFAQAHLYVDAPGMVARPPPTTSTSTSEDSPTSASPTSTPDDAAGQTRPSMDCFRRAAPAAGGQRRGGLVRERRMVSRWVSPTARS